MTDDRPKAAEQIATLKRLAKEAFELEELCALPQFGWLVKEKELELVDEASVKRHGASCGLDLLPQCSHKGWSWTKNSLMSEVWRVGVDRILVPFRSTHYCSPGGIKMGMFCQKSTGTPLQNTE